jgi:hypothetical protein
MRQTVNLISDINSKFRSNFGFWQIENAFIRLEKNDVIASGYNSLRLIPQASDQPVVLFLDDIQVDQINATDTLQFHFRQKSISTCVTTIILRNSNGEEISTDSRTNLDLWTIVRSDLFLVPDIGGNLTVSIEIRICGHNGQEVLFSVPFLYASGSIFRNLYARQVFNTLPNVIRQADVDHLEQHGKPDYPLLRVIELVSGDAGESFRNFYEFYYLDNEEGKDENDPSTKSKLVDPDVVKLEYMAWLAQFAGVIFDNPTLGSTPWGNLPQDWDAMQTEIDPNPNPEYTPSSLTRTDNIVTATIGSHIVEENQWISVTGTQGSTTFDGGYQIISVEEESISWAQDGPDETASVTGNVLLLDTEWFEIEAFNPDLSSLDSYLRWQIKYAYNGVNAGTKEALINSVKRELTDTRTVTVNYRYEGNPWRVLVRTKTSETPDGVNGQPSSTILNYIAKVKPAGFQIIHQCTESGT